MQVLIDGEGDERWRVYDNNNAADADEDVVDDGMDLAPVADGGSDNYRN